MKPPTLARFLLMLAPRDYRDIVAGDLYEEFVQRGGPKRWYWRQVTRSLPGMLALRARRNAWLQPTTLSLVACAWLAVAGCILWTFVLSQVPLKADPAHWFRP